LYLKQAAASIEKRMRAGEFSDWHEVRNKPGSFAKPGMKMKSGRLDREGRNERAIEIERDGMIWRRANRRRNARELRQHGPVHMACGDNAHVRVAPDRSREIAGILQVLPIHMLDAGLERRKMQEQKRRTLPVRSENLVEQF
jgi:hypothetical protein